MRYLSLAEVLNLHQAISRSSGGAGAIRDLPALEAAIAQPYSAFDGVELYPDLFSKAAALCF